MNNTNFKPKTAIDIQNTFYYLIDAVCIARDGDKEDIENGGFTYARMILEAGEYAMREIAMYEIILQTFVKAEQLAMNEQYQEALDLLRNTLSLLIEKSHPANLPM
jgi:hypothetical protein